MSETTKKVPIGLQLYLYGMRSPRTCPFAFESIAKIGYAGVEPYGYDGEKLNGWVGSLIRCARCWMTTAWPVGCTCELRH